MINKGDKLYWITKDEEDEVSGVEVYRVFSKTSTHIILEGDDRELHNIRSYLLGVRAFLDSNAARAVIETRKLELKATYEEQIDGLNSELLKLEGVKQVRMRGSTHDWRTK